MTDQQPEAPDPPTDEFAALRAVVGRLGVAGTLRALAALAVGDDTGQPSSWPQESAQPRSGASEPEPSLGEILHRARQAGGAGRPRPWPVEDWADRHPDLRALDEAMAEAVAAAVRERDGARLAAISDHCRQRMNAPGRSGMTRAAAAIILGLAEGGEEPQDRSDDKKPGP